MLQEVEGGVSGTVVGVFATLSELLPDDVLHVYSCTLSCNGKSIEVTCSGVQAPAGRGLPNFFELPPMSAGGGWDEAAWAAAGLPVAGELLLSLHMHNGDEQQPGKRGSKADASSEASPA